MNLPAHERRHLVRALQLYEAGESHRGDYQLWVGFGDGWTDFRTRLVQRGYIRTQADGSVVLSSKGTGLFEQIRSIAA